MQSHTRSLPLIILLLVLTLACGSFAPRPGETPPPLPTWTPRPATATATFTPQPALSASSNPSAQSSATAIADPPRSEPTQQLLTPTPTPTPSGDIVIGRQARIVAPTGVNIRQQPGVRAGRVGYFASGILVRVVDGPVYADDYVWWQVDDGYGKSGWVAGGDGEDLWLNGKIGEPRAVNRPVRLGDRVTVTVSPRKTLTVRYEPGKRGFVARRLVPGTRLDIIEGPVYLNDMRWWKVRRQDGLTGWASEGDSKNRWLTPIE